MNFVSESELQTQRESGNVDDEPVDHRPLYERLKEVREKEEAEKQEMFALKNQFRGLDEEETDFLDKINQAKCNFEKKKRQEEEELLKQAMKVDAIASSSTNTSVISLKPSVGKVGAKDSKKNVLKNLVVKRKSESTASEEVKTKQKKNEDNPKNEAKETSQSKMDEKTDYNIKEEETDESRIMQSVNDNNAKQGKKEVSQSKMIQNRNEDIVKQGKKEVSQSQTKMKKAGELLIGYAISSDEEDL